MVYIDGFVAPVIAGTTQEAYIAFAEKVAPIFKQYGVVRMVEGWGDDVPDGKITDFRRAVQATEDEVIVFSWLEWPSKEVRDAGMSAVMADPRMQPGAAEPAPFDMKRMIYGGFQAIFDA